MASPEEIEAANLIVAREASNVKNWKTHAICIGLLSLLFVVNLFRGSSKNPSIINIQKCGVLDWSIFMGFIVVNIVVFYTQVIRVQSEERLKNVTKIGLCKSDI